ncbi:uncharacterized protein TM35_000231620 [Trypanosoma theileri]|uniref:Uncharacterized protein n=1 Tax=Trypanosoma theileri TaxID=67003 RepID=A0A1X0NRH4_9TRYP|nr:uncharacterized protein TM35_000231620 [Trypanosoma theileri]ORC87191.1 hypothetical protein TM35_000231620 [Trypanosoma theileri]
MIRRRVCCVPLTAVGSTEVVLSTSLFSSQRHQGGLHTFIRDSQSSNFSKSARRESSPRGSNHTTASTNEDGRTSSTDWVTQMQKELFSEADPLGGQAHKDYYRDPASGYSPQYAPRNFAEGGAIAYHHPQSVFEYEDAVQRRNWLDHDVSRLEEEFRQQRASLRSIENPTEREELTRSYASQYNTSNTIVENQSIHAVNQLHHSTSTSGNAIRQQSITDRYKLAEQQSPLPMTSSMDSKSLTEAYMKGVESVHDDWLEENLRIIHGLREKEKFDFTIMQRTSRIPFKGYDMDRFLAQQKGTPYGAQQLPPLMASSSMEEAQRTLREGEKGEKGEQTTRIPLFESISQKAFARNTVSDQPGMGEALTQEIVDTIRATKATEEEKHKQERAQRFGIGRQGALVQDGGPDKRILKKHTNDERLLDAMLFSSDAYRKTSTDEHWNPYVRQDTSQGVGHLLNTKFDLARREDRLAKGEQDLTERSVMHFGVPIQQTMDEFVFRHRNARGERPLDYFKPFPDFRSLRLNRMYRDVEGFSLMKQRPEFLEWELFTRYRAHHQQRRHLALLHGLEPVVNETVEERDARREKLNKLCESTPFDEKKYLHTNDDEMRVSGETLRSWFGMYMLPSPTIVEAVVGASTSVNLHLYPLIDEMGTTDTREHVLSSRYFNRLFLMEAYQHRIGRGFTGNVSGKAPEPIIQYAQSPEVLRHFNAEERAMYEQYIKEQTSEQLNEWNISIQRRRWLPEHQQYGHVIAHGYEVPVVDLIHTETGSILTVLVKSYEKEIQTARENPHHHTILIDGQSYKFKPDSERRVIPLSVKLESGEVVDMTDEIFNQYEMERISENLNHSINYGIGHYAYNRGNYVETQDVIWEEQTARGEEGWSPATHADGLVKNLPIRARRHLGSHPDGSRIVSTPQRAVIIEYHRQPFFNPEPRLVRVAFQSDGSIEDVPLSDIMIWQRRYYGPERTVGDESRRHNPMSLRRYVDVADPFNEKNSSEEHFLDKYELARTSESVANKYRTTKQITEIDQWTRFDSTRADNYRPLSISHRRDYIRLGYMHHFTPWEWILVQEADQPLIAEQIRQDDMGPSYYFSPNRFWRYKARPHGYIRHFENEVRDLFQFIDGVTPWKQAQKIRTYWEVRSHHPMPQFNRPEVAMHRNTVGLLPAHMWETDKKTGKVKAVKDSVRDYQTKTPLPKWVHL